jgi:hypothetical protein
MRFSAKFAEDLFNATDGPLEELIQKVMFLQDTGEEFIPDLAFARKHAVEIGGGTDSMRGNKQAAVTDDSIICEGKPLPPTEFVVSKNVICQLDDVKQEVVSHFDGAHQYPVSIIKKPSVTNPTGIWHDHKQKPFPNRIDTEVAPGHMRSQFCIPEDYGGHAVLDEPKFEILAVSPETAELMSLVDGETINTKTISVEEGGCGPEKVRTKAKIGYFGQHSDNTVTIGSISPKLDGVFCRASNLFTPEGRVLKLKFRNGHTYTGTCKDSTGSPAPEFDFGLEIFGTLHFVITYIRLWKGVTLPYCSQEAVVMFNRLKRFVFNLVTKDGPVTLYGIPFMRGLPSDGVVVSVSPHQYFFKYIKTADLTRGFCKILQDQRIPVDTTGMPNDCRVGEFELVNGGYRYKRPRPDKLIPNTIDNVLKIMQNVNVAKLKSDCPNFEERLVTLDPENRKITGKIKKCKQYPML